MRVIQIIVLGVAALGILALILVLGLRSDIGAQDADFPELIGTTNVTAANSKRRDPTQLRGLVWNIHYGYGGEVDHFARHSEVEVNGTLEALAQFIKEADVDFVMLQEVDLAADRTFQRDQLRWLAEQAGFPHYAFVTTWKARYIPFPMERPAEWIGRMHSGQGVLSRFPIRRNRRVRLPQPAENPFWYNWFYLNRAVQIVELDVPGEQPVQLFNVHLEAFSQSNREQQARQLKDLVWRDARQDDRILVAGDFNATAPEAPNKNRFPDEPETDFTNDTTIATVRAGMPTVDLLMRFKVPDRVFTFPASAPTRQLDHLFAGRAWSRSYGWVNPPAQGVLSDHLPLRVVLTGAPSPRAGKRSRRTEAPPAPGRQPATQNTSTPPKQDDRLPVFKGDTGVNGLGVEIRDKRLLERPTPVQGKPPRPPKVLNPKGWLRDAGPVIE